ncbi:MAG: hypothetical protein VX528_17065, partial [Candidatus Latescibacterota bacterium]|nr:hypothetical protein [Candidatus Latescibacterota bacterium]
CLARGIKVFPESFSSLGQAINDFGCDVNLKPTLNLVSDFTYHDDFAASFAFLFNERGPAGSYFTRVNAKTGIIDQLRPKDMICRDFNPDDRAATLTGSPTDGNVWNVFWQSLNKPVLDKHVFDETGDVGQLVQAGQWDLALIGSQFGAGNPGHLNTILDYIAPSPTTVQYPNSASSTFMLDDRYFVGGTPRAFGGAVRLANLDNSNGSGILEAILSTNGGRLVTLKSGSSPWLSWTQSDPSADPTGDYGWTVSGLATYNISPMSMPPDTLDEVFAVGATYTDPTDAHENDSHLMIFESNGSGVLSQVFSGDLGQAGCTGLWVGPAIGRCPCQGVIHVIVGQAQTFAIYQVNRAAKTVDLANPVYVSPGLGSGIGAANSIKVLAAQPATGGKKVDYIFLGSDAYFYAFKSPEYTSIH